MTGLGYQLRKRRAKRPLGRYTLAANVYPLANVFLPLRRNGGRPDFSTPTEASKTSSTT